MRTFVCGHARADFFILFHFSAALTELAFPNLSIYTEAYVP